MSPLTLILRSLQHHARAHLGVLLGATIGSAVLIGALLVGDSVRESLRELAFARLGQTRLALAAGDRLFRAQLALELQDALKQPGLTTVAPVLQLPGTATSGDGGARANRVQVQGVDARFWQLANAKPAFGVIPDDAVVLNESLAAQLKAKAGDTVLLRVPKPSKLSRDAPMSPEEDSAVAMRVTVHAVANDAAFGRFGLQASQLAPFNAFVPLAWFQKKLEADGKANLLLAGGEATDQSTDDSALVTQVNGLIRQNWKLADAGLTFKEVKEAGALELRTERVFLDAPIVEAAKAAGPKSQTLLTYFVNEIALGDKATPYSMVAALGEPIVPADLREDEMLINQWLADDLGAKAGDELRVTYYVVGLARKLEERTNTFRVRAVLPIKGAAADRELMPDFPGMKDAKNCREWDTGFPINTERIREKDQKYWEDHKGTPKAFISLAAGQKLWANRFGDATAVRYPLAETSADALTKAILGKLDPAAVSLKFDPVRAQAMASVDQAQDFGQLFIGFSFFLIVAALLLMSLLFQFGVEQRAVEVGTLLALGFTPRSVRRLLLGEGLLLGVLGGLLGLAGGIGYARAMLYGLSTAWQDAVGTSALHYHAQPATLAIGWIAAVVVAGGTVWLALRKQIQQPARELLAESDAERAWKLEPVSPKHSRAALWAGACLVAALGLVGWAVSGGETAAAGAFFGAGGLLLVAALGFTAAFLTALGQSAAAAQMSLAGMGVRNSTRRRRRSLATVAMLACGSFLVVAVGANKLDATRDAQKRSSGTGGFAFIGETSLPVVHDLNAAAGRDYFALRDADMQGVSVVPLRVRDGDDASCLNLNRAQKPRLLGVNPEQLAERQAFTFAKVAKDLPKDEPWRLLKRPPGSEAVPAIGDAASIQWALGKKVGDELDYTDERGRAFKVRIVGAVANSILQGNLLIDEQEFVARFPSEAGYRMFLVDAPTERAEKVSEVLTRALRNEGLELTPTVRRLDAFNAVQNTYLSTFQALGGLGLLLGSAGLGVVVLRNVLERRSELALLLAVGFRARALKWLVVSEHGALLVLGLAAGVVSAVVAVLPALLSPGADVPVKSLGLTLAAVLFSGGVWTWVATMLALRGKLVDALRNN
ncbi:MAG: ABC transporter permease [Verrucomicrobiota bacterium]